MTDLQEKAMKMALEVLNIQTPLDKREFELRNSTIEALRQALAEPANSTTDFVEPKASSQTGQKTPLKVLNLTVFTENRLRNGRVYDVETLQAMTSRDILAIPDIGKKALKEVLEALDVYAVNISQERVDETAKRKHEPVAWGEFKGDKLHDLFCTKYDADNIKKFRKDESVVKPLYTAPPKREWVGLTENEIEEIARWADKNAAPWYLEYAKGIEAKLKEKNV